MTYQLPERAGQRLPCIVLLFNSLRGPVILGSRVWYDAQGGGAGQMWPGDHPLSDYLRPVTFCPSYRAAPRRSVAPSSMLFGSLWVFNASGCNRTLMKMAEAVLILQYSACRRLPRQMRRPLLPPAHPAFALPRVPCSLPTLQSNSCCRASLSCPCCP